MTPILKFALVATAIACFAACQRSQEHKKATLETEEALPVANAPSAYKDEVAANGNAKRSFMRTADIKFRVNDVAKTTYAIEQLVIQAGGFVTKSHLVSRVENSNQVQVSEDSSLRTVQYTVENTMQLRVPDRMLDSTLRSLAPLASYLDFRRVDADDVALRLLAEKMHADRNAESKARLSGAIDRGGKLKDITEAERQVLERQEEVDAAKVSRLSFQDRVDFSTVTLVMYQPSAILHEPAAVNKTVEAWRPGFGQELIGALLSGWHLLETILVFIARLWGAILLLVVLYLVYRRTRRRIGPAQAL